MPGGVNRTPRTSNECLVWDKEHPGTRKWKWQCQEHVNNSFSEVALRSPGTARGDPSLGLRGNNPALHPCLPFLAAQLAALTTHQAGSHLPEHHAQEKHTFANGLQGPWVKGALLTTRRKPVQFPHFRTEKLQGLISLCLQALKFSSPTGICVRHTGWVSPISLLFPNGLEKLSLYVLVNSARIILKP